MPGSQTGRLVGFFLLLTVMAGWGWRFYSESQAVLARSDGNREFEGNDWVIWEDEEGKVMADRVHPLPAYKPFPEQRVQPGDRLRKIDYHEVYQAEVAEEVSRSAPPGKTFLFQVERTDLQGTGVEVLVIRVISGFRLAFGFNRIGTYWRIGSWLSGAGTFVAFLVLLILFPFIRSDRQTYFPLSMVVGLGLLLFSLQFAHYLYLIIESDLVDTSGEKVFTWLFAFLSAGYVLSYFFFKVKPGQRWMLLPSVALGGFFLAWLFSIIFIQDNLGSFHRLVEWLCLIFFLVHAAVPVMLNLVEGAESGGLRTNWITVFTALLCMAGVVVLMFLDPAPDFYEHLLFAFMLLLFFPLLDAAYFRLRFGKVSLVVTRGLQYLFFFGLGLFFYALVAQFFQYLLPSNPYRSLLEIITLLFGIMVGYGLYRGNESRLASYFVTTQQQRIRRMRAFIATIPQYTASSALMHALQTQVSEYFEASPPDFWWHGEGEAESELQEEALYHALVAQGAVWSRNKELSTFRGEEKQEDALLQSQYSLVAPLQVTEDRYGLLLLGRKKRGVYNLSDLELLSQLIQQTQLTLNVLQLLQREKELLQQSYEANLTALRSQINPHFLFNTLNTISALVHDSPDLAEEAVEKLAFIFRYTLKFSSQNLVSLDNEIRLVSTYLDIEKIRFGDRLHIQIEVEPDVSGVQIPAFVLQTLVENCIKHGISKIIGKGIISIDAYPEEDFLVCEVYDNGPGIDPERITQGTGLNNVLARLENIYGIKNLLYFENTGNGTRVQLKIPITL